MLRIITLCTAMLAGAFGATTSWAEPLEFDFVAETRVEYATNKGLLEDPTSFLSPFYFVDDFGLGTNLEVSSSMPIGKVRLGASYSYDRTFHQNYSTFDQIKHTTDIHLTTEPTPATQFWLRYRSKNIVPDGWVGDIYIDIVSTRFRFPQYQVGDYASRYRPYLLLEWETSDFKLLNFLDRTKRSGELGLQIQPSGEVWQSDLVLNYGESDALSKNFSHQYIDVEWVHKTNLDKISTRPFAKDLSVSFDVSYRREWFEGPSTNIGTHGLDHEVEAIVKLSKKLKTNVAIIAKFEAENHISNRQRADFFETKTKLSIELNF